MLLVTFSSICQVPNRNVLDELALLSTLISSTLNAVCVGVGTLTVMLIGEYAVFAGAVLEYVPFAVIVSVNGTIVVIGGSG